MPLLKARRPARKPYSKQSSTPKTPSAPAQPAAKSPIPAQTPPTAASPTLSLQRTSNFSSRPAAVTAPNAQSVRSSATTKTASKKTPSKWEALSTSERATCVGDQYEEKCFKMYRWDIQGKLRDETWDKEVHPELKEIVNNHFADIYSKGGIHEVCYFHLWLLSSDDDPATAQPTIIVITNNKETGKRTTKTILKSASFKNLNAGFDIKVLTTKVQFLATEDLGTDHGPDPKGPFDSLCGSRVFVSAIPVTEGSTWKQTTLGGVLVLDRQYYGVTVAHCFRTDLNIAIPEVDSFSDCSDDSDQSTEAGLGASNPKTEFKGKGSILGRENSSSDLPPQGIYVGSLESGTANQPASDNFSACSPDKLALVGHIFPHIDHSEGANKTAFLSDELDWALVKIRDTRFMQRNEVVISPGVHIHPSFINFNDHLPPRKAFLACGVSGTREVNMSGTTCSIHFPWMRTLQTVWTIEFATAKGDSGSWVIGRDGRIYGMVVAAIPLLKLAYVLRAEDLFESIISYSPTRITLSDIFPTNTLEELEVIPNQLSAEEEVDFPPDWMTTARRNIQSYVPFEGGPASQGFGPPFGAPSTAHDSGFVSQTPYADIAEAEALLFDEAKLLKVQDRLQPLAVAFMEIIPGDFEACKDFVMANLDILTHDTISLTSEAVRAFSERRILFTRACIERIVMIQDLSTAETRDEVQNYFDPLIRHDQEKFGDFSNRLNIILNEVKIQGQNLPEPAATALPAVMYNSRSDREQTRPSTVSSTRLLDRVKDISGRDMKFRTRLGMRTVQSTSQVKEGPIPVDDPGGIGSTSNLGLRLREGNVPPRIAGSGEGTRETLDPRYMVRTSNFFFDGRVFAMLWHETSAYPSSRSAPESHDKFGQAIYTTIRRMIVARRDHGYSLCIPIVTYGGRGATKASLTTEDVAVHAVAHMKGTQPQPLPEELSRGMLPDPICIIPSSPSQKLLPSSRINFGKIYSVEHNVKVADIGRVDPDCMERFQAYFFNIMRKPKIYR